MSESVFREATLEQSPQERLESIVSSLEKKGGSAAPVVEAIALATAHPEAVADLAIAVMGRFPKGGTFLDAALSYLSDEAWQSLVRHALDVFEAAAGENEAAASVIAYASLQCPRALHPHLNRIFVVRPNARCYYESYPWRESGEQHFDYLQEFLAGRSATEDERRRAWAAMCETRHVKLIEHALAHAEQSHDRPPAGWSQAAWVEARLHLVGFHLQNGVLHRACPTTLYHLQFPDSFFASPSRPPWLARVHPTWKLLASPQSVPFGGVSNSRCSLCGENLHRLLVLDPVPAGLGIAGRTRLELAACLSCLGWERQPLFYQHDQHGNPMQVGYDGPSVKPQFPAGPLKETTVRLAETPRRWYWQDWALSNSRENLNRVGGEPCWIQNAEYPRCPSCQELMSYFMQLDSDLATEDGNEWLWGSGGIVYGFWCDRCAISGFFWQCT